MVDFGRPADLVVVNSCTVTHKADFDVRAAVRRAHRDNPRVKIVVTGCLAQLRPEDLAEMPGVVLVLGQDQKPGLIQHLEQAVGSENALIIVTPPGTNRSPLAGAFPAFSRTRAFFRIQDGCSARCSYCTVPLARGPSRSLPADRVSAGLDHYHETGCAEIVLTGIHLGAWGLDLDPKTDLTSLLTRELARPGARLRLSSIEPNEVTDGIIDLFANSPRLCPHLHLAVQSGSNHVLKVMRRPYKRKLVRDLVEKLLGKYPGICLGADLLVGFPGETEDNFSRTAELMESLPWAYFHVFPFSARPGTPAATFDHKVPDQEVRRRVTELRRIDREKRKAFHRAAKGKVRPTLIENTRDRTGYNRGLTDNYIKVLLPDPVPEAGRVVPVRLVDFSSQGRMLGEMD